eukprot:m.97852 g.97852  ORF g.97852 m.97852 type:complete len:660 (+) comp27016_c0_seq1:1025-3004(+)
MVIPCIVMAALRVLTLHALLVVASGSVIVNTPYGTVRGFSLNGTNAWRGIRYAAPPLGDLRLRPPKLPSRWDGIMDTIDFGATCLQIGSPSVVGSQGHQCWNSLNVTNSSEDCLFVNVYSPATPTVAGPLPVMVYLHAGEFRGGGSNDLENSWPYFSHGAVVLVTLNCRLGAFGFAALDALRGRDVEAGSTGNYGMQDQRMALQWVQASIASFGGDPKRVTIFGESSGGSSVMYHLVNDRSKPLFHRAILESPGITQTNTWERASGNTNYLVSSLTANLSDGCAWPVGEVDQTWNVFTGVEVSKSSKPLAMVATMAEATRLCVARPDCYVLQVLLNTSVTLYGFRAGRAVSLLNTTRTSEPRSVLSVHVRDADSTLAVGCLMRASADQLVRIGSYDDPHGDSVVLDALAPAIDGVELSAPLTQLYKTNMAQGIDVLAGSNLDEGTEFMGATPPLACNASAADLRAWATLQFGDEIGQLLPSAYAHVVQPVPQCAHHASSSAPSTPTSSSWQIAARAAGDSTITCRTRELLKHVGTTGGRAFWYHFRITPLFSVNVEASRMESMGAFHGAEVPFVFGVPIEVTGEGERNASRAMGCWWVNFATTGDPNNGPCTTTTDQAVLPVWGTINGTLGNAMIITNTSLSMNTAVKQSPCDMFARFP